MLALKLVKLLGTRSIVRHSMHLILMGLPKTHRGLELGVAYPNDWDSLGDRKWCFNNIRVRHAEIWLLVFAMLPVARTLPNGCIRHTANASTEAERVVLGSGRHE